MSLLHTVHACKTGKVGRESVGVVWLINGYICTFDVYTGKDTSGSTVHAHGLAYSIVMKLVQSYLKKGHIVYTDNYYSSPQLFEDLWKEGTYASGTVWTNRKHFPDFLKPQPGDKLDRGSQMFAYYKSTTVVRWSDNKDVYALSTFLFDATTQVKRQSGSASISISWNHPRLQPFHGWCRLGWPSNVLLLCRAKEHEMVATCLLVYARSCNHQCSCDLQGKHSHISFKTHPQSKIQASPHTTTSWTIPISKRGVGRTPTREERPSENTFHIILQREGGAKCVHTKKSPKDLRNARIPRPRYGAPSVKFTYAWADVLSFITLITETIDFTFLWFSVYSGHHF